MGRNPRCNPDTLGYWLFIVALINRKDEGRPLPLAYGHGLLRHVRQMDHAPLHRDQAVMDDRVKRRPARTMVQRSRCSNFDASIDNNV